MSKLKPEIKQAFLTALRSGKYAQGRGRLHCKDESGQRFCCLGVLSDLAVMQGLGYWQPNPSNSKDNTMFWVPASGNENDASSAYLPPDVCRWAFEESCFSIGNDPRVSDPLTGVSMNLSHLNDGCNDRPPRSFAAIANIIEEQL